MVSWQGLGLRWAGQVLCSRIWVADDQVCRVTAFVEETIDGGLGDAANYFALFVCNDPATVDFGLEAEGSGDVIH
eukprot:1354812-Amorphochlora_amoeboformis.AAC.1